jgi:hypothetical protein
VETAVVAGPGVEVIEVEPAPMDRVYVYEVGYPPGCYVYGDYYYYNGYRYPHDVFVRQVVTVNIRENRYVNVEENRRAGVRIEEQHRQEFAVNHGRPNPAERAPQTAGRNVAPADEAAQPRAVQTARPAATRSPNLRVDKRQGAQASVRE